MAIDSAVAKKDYYRALYEVAKTVNSSLSLSQVLNRVAESTAHAMGAKACSLRLLDSLRATLEIVASYGLSAPYIAKGPVEIAKSLVDAKALQGRPVHVSDPQTDPRLQYPDEMVREGIASLVVVPVMVKDTAIGVMRVYTAEARAFGAEDMAFLEAIASLGGIAIENARTYEALEEQFLAIRREKLPWAENFHKPYWRG